MSAAVVDTTARQGIAVDRKLLEKQQRTDRNNHNRYKADDAVERIHDRRLRTLELLGSRRNGGDIIISAHMFDLRAGSGR